MRFSAEQAAEWGDIRDKIHRYNGLMRMPRFDDFGRVLNVFLPDLKPDKVALEQLYSDTDIKKEKVASLQVLLQIERLIYETQGKFVDMKKYTKMALKIDPDDACFNFRNGIILKCLFLNKVGCT